MNIISFVIFSCKYSNFRIPLLCFNKKIIAPIVQGIERKFPKL